MKLCENCQNELKEYMAQITLNYKDKSREDLEKALAMSALLLAVTTHELKGQIIVSNHPNLFDTKLPTT